jgi:hypothetical protein
MLSFGISQTNNGTSNPLGQLELWNSSNDSHDFLFLGVIIFPSNNGHLYYQVRKGHCNQ